MERTLHETRRERMNWSLELVRHNYILRVCFYVRKCKNQTYVIIFLRLKSLCIHWTCAQIGTNSWISKSLNNSFLFKTFYVTIFWSKYYTWLHLNKKCAKVTFNYELFWEMARYFSLLIIIFKLTIAQI